MLYYNSERNSYLQTICFIMPLCKLLFLSDNIPEKYYFKKKKKRQNDIEFCLPLPSLSSLCADIYHYWLIVGCMNFVKYRLWVTFQLHYYTIYFIYTIIIFSHTNQADITSSLGLLFFLEIYYKNKLLM